jgi:hypothetical protein
MKRWRGRAFTGLTDHQTERGQDLFAVDWRELFHRLEFYNDAAFHDRPCHVIEKKRVLTRRRGGRGGVFRCRVHK